MIVAQRLRKGSCSRAAKRLVADALSTVARLHTGADGPTALVRMDSAFYGRPAVAAALRAGAQVSVTVRLDPKVKATLAAIPQESWTAIEYTDAVFDEAAGRWVPRAEVAEIAFTAFS